jgi:hypothetical protein
MKPRVARAGLAVAVAAVAAVVFAAAGHADQNRDYLLDLQRQGMVILPQPNAAAPWDGAAPWLALGKHACEVLKAGGGEQAAIDDLSTWDATSMMFRLNAHAIRAVVAAAHRTLCLGA